MKIIIARDAVPNKAFMALAPILTSIGEDVLVWDIQHKAVFDMFEEQSPDFLFINQASITEEIVRALEDYPNIKTILYGIHVPRIMQHLAPPLALCVPPNINERLLQHTGDVPLMKMECAANLIQLSNGYYVDRIKSDVLYVCSSDISKREYITRTVNGVLANTNWSVKCVGSHFIPSALFVGVTDTQETMNFLASTTIAVDYDHDMFYDLLANNVFTLTNITQQTLMPSFGTEVELVELISKYIGARKARRKYSKEAYKIIIEKDTYFHRLAELAEILGKSDWKEKSLDALRRFRQ